MSYIAREDAVQLLKKYNKDIRRSIALSSDVLASAVSAYTYKKNDNLDIRNGFIMMLSVLVFTVVGSYVSSLVPSTTMGNFSVFMTFLLGIKFIVKPVMTTKESMERVDAKKRAVQSVVCGMSDWTVWILGVVFTFVWARIAAVIANKATPKALNRMTGVILVVLGIVIMLFNVLA